MSELNIKNVRAFSMFKPGNEVLEEATQEIADLCDQLHQIRIAYDPAVWGHGDQSFDSSVIVTCLRTEIAGYKAKIKARDTEEIRAIIVGS